MKNNTSDMAAGDRKPFGGRHQTVGSQWGRAERSLWITTIHDAWKKRVSTRFVFIIRKESGERF